MQDCASTAPESSGSPTNKWTVADTSAPARRNPLTITDPRRRTTRSVPGSTPNDPVEALDLVVETCHRLNRMLPAQVLDREELIALAGLLTQVSGALLRLTDLLVAPIASCDRARQLRPDADKAPVAASTLVGARAGYRVAYSSARAMHANLKR